MLKDRQRLLIQLPWNPIANVPILFLNPRHPAYSCPENPPHTHTQWICQWKDELLFHILKTYCLVINMVHWKGLGNVSCTFLHRTCIYGPGCMTELHKEHLHPAGPHTSWHHRVELLGLVGLPGAKKPEGGNTSREKHSGGQEAGMGQNAWNKWGRHGKGSWEGRSNLMCSLLDVK